MHGDRAVRACDGSLPFKGTGFTPHCPCPGYTAKTPRQKNRRP